MDAIDGHPFELTVDAAGFGGGFAVLRGQPLLTLLLEGPGQSLGNEPAAFPARFWEGLWILT